MVVAYGTSKKGKTYSRSYLVREAKDQSFGYLDQKDQFFTDTIRPIGEIINVEQTEVNG